MNSAPARAQACAILAGPDGIDGVSARLVGLGRVDLGVGGAVDHHVTGFDESLGCGGVGDIPLR